MGYIDKIIALTKQLQPTGRAWKMPWDGAMQKLYEGLAESEARAYEDGLSTLSSLLPDNDNFTVDDATDWERRLGMITDGNVSLADRKAAIIRKMNYPGLNPAKLNYLYLQSQLQLAGFNVYVYENRFPLYPSGYYTQSPWDVTMGDTSLLSSVQHGDFQHGPIQHGVAYNNKVANSIDKNVDFQFSLGGTYKCTFFIGGSSLGTFANVPASRETEFRQTILKLKPVNKIAFLLINYV